MTDILITAGVMLLCLIAEGFFSGSEIAVASADRNKLRHEAAKGSRGARLALSMLKRPEWLLSTTLIGTNISVVTNTTMATALLIQCNRSPPLEILTENQYRIHSADACQLAQLIRIGWGTGSL
jgi:Mg2+/Co2+ transporter CorB